MRIGQLLRPEFAAWRYGDQFRAPQTPYLGLPAGAAVVGVGVAAGSVALGATPVFLNLGQLWWTAQSKVKIRIDQGHV